MEKIISRKLLRKKRNFRLRKKIFGTSDRPRLVVFVSNKHFYAQLIDDNKKETLLTFSSLNLSDNKSINNKEICAQVGSQLALLALKQKITKVVFDRAGFLFHGKIKSFAEAARKEGLIF